MNRERFTSGKVKIPNGETLNVMVHGTGPDVLFMIHGMWLDYRSVETLFPYLGERFTLIAPDFRGHGQSSYVNPITNVMDFVEDLAMLIDYFEIPKVYFLGWCGGSSVALKYASLYPERVEKLIIVSPPGLEGLPLWKKDREKQTKTPIENKEDLKNHMSLQMLNKGLKEQNKEIMKQIIIKANFNKRLPEPEILDSLAEQLLLVNNIDDIAWSAYTCNLTDHKKWITEGSGSILKVQNEALLFYSEDDTLIPRAAIDQYFGYFGDRIKLRLFNDAGHAVHLIYPKEVSEEVIKFCDNKLIKSE